MTLRLKSIFLIIIGLALLWFLYIERGILTPFVLAAIFAYIFNPVVSFFSNKLKLPRTLSVVIIYLLLISVIISFAVVFSQRIVGESAELQKDATLLTQTAKSQINTMPDWLRPTVADILSTFEKSTNVSYPSLFSFFPQVFSRILSLIIFLFSAFYFLQGGRKMVDKALNFIPHHYRFELDILLNKINSVLVGYLRGQLFLVFFVSLTLFIALTILGVKFSFILAIFSGFAEIVPIIGPIVAATVGGIVAYLGGTSNFGLDPIQMVIAVIIIYFVIRQIEDYFVIPVVMGKITRLHPLVILFAVIAGEHTAGILGLILAVPIAGILLIIFEYSLEKISTREQ
jgi:predicted PurR-regulated permease PerM